MADKIVAEYIVKTDKAVAELNKVLGRLDAIEKERKQNQEGFKSMSKNMVNSFKQVGAAIGVAFGTEQIISFGKESVKLASQMEGVERAFKRIGGANSANLLEGLRKATRGTVSDLQLMQRAVQASNFKIPLENLASLFKFAQARARETGESVEFLTNSIVLGIGRKSPLILDNLGISAVELRTRLKGVGVEAANVGDIAAIIGDIATEELEKMGDQADTTADRIAQLNTVLENSKVLIGEGLIDAADAYLEKLEPIVQESKEAADSILTLAENTGYLDAVLKVGSGALDFATKKYRDIYESLILAAQGVNVFVDEAQKAAFRLTLNNEELIKFNDLGEKAQDIMVRRWMAQEEYADITEDAVRATELFNKKTDEGSEKVQKIIENLAFYNNLIKDLRKEQSKANTTRERVRQLEDEINEAIRQRLILLGRLREVGGETLQGIESIAEIELLAQQELTDNILEDAERRNAGLEAAGQSLADSQKNLQQQITADLEAEQERRDELVFASIDATSNLVSSIVSLQNSFIQQELQNLNSALETGAITREEYEQRRKELLREQAENQKAAAIFQATIEGGAAIINALRIDPTGLLAAIVGATVATEIAAIASQPLPEFAEGGFVNEHGEFIGRKHGQGGVRIEAEGGEFITSAKHAQPNKEILKAINSGEWEKYKLENIIAPAINQVMEGGFQGMGASYKLQNNFNDKNLLRLGDRNRKAAHNDAVYIVSELKKVIKPRKRGGFA